MEAINDRICPVCGSRDCNGPQVHAEPQNAYGDDNDSGGSFVPIMIVLYIAFAALIVVAVKFAVEIIRGVD